MPFWFEVTLAATGAFDQGMWGTFARIHGCSNDNIGGRGRLRRPEIVLLSSIQFIAGVVDTGEQFIAGVVDTGQK